MREEQRATALRFPDDVDDVQVDIAEDWVVDPGEALGKRFSSAAAALAS